MSFDDAVPTMDDTSVSWPSDFNTTFLYDFTNGTNVTYSSSDGMRGYLQIIMPVVYAAIVILGFVGNVLVVIVVFNVKQMRNTTNILIINLALADLFFIVICVPFTATLYVSPRWLFGDTWCRIYGYMIYVCAYASVYTLVLMSLDRYLAVVHAISSMGIRTLRNASIIISILWVSILLFNIPVFLEHKVIKYHHNGVDRSSCLNERFLNETNHEAVFYTCFFGFGYFIPLTVTCVLYGFMLKRLLYGMSMRTTQSSESIRAKKRVTRMVIAVVAMFAICWLPFHVVFMSIAYIKDHSREEVEIVLKIVSSIFAYMNSCVNPFLYAFLSENFRKSFRKLLCGEKFQHIKMEFERTANTKGIEMSNHETKTYKCQEK